MGAAPLIDIMTLGGAQVNLGSPDSVPAACKAVQLFDTDPGDDWIFPQTEMGGAGAPIPFNTDHSGIGRLAAARDRLISEARSVNVPVEWAS